MNRHSTRPVLRSAFTLIELLVVIAIIAILAVVVVLTLNPAQLLAQSRDANRVSDIATLTSALTLYTTDQAGASSFSLGNGSSTAISVPDPSASSTCGSLGLPSLGTGLSWSCASSANYRQASSTGWTPVNFQSISAGSPIGNLPIDPVNQTSSGLFYSYNTNGSQFTVTADLESSKYKQSYGNSPQTTYFPEVISGGVSSISALYNPTGLVAYWSMNEGNGSSTFDQSGNGNGGTWTGTPLGTSGYYSAGKVGSWAGYFDGNTDYVTTPDSTSTDFVSASSYTLAAWINPNSVTGNGGIIDKGSTANGYGIHRVGNQIQFGGHNGGNFLSSSTISAGVWYFVAATYNPSASPEGSIFINGKLDATNALYPYAVSSVGSSTYIGVYNGGDFFGLIDDARVYNRALSPAEIQALYNAEK